MPHDKNGTVLQPGDSVLIRGTVREVHAGEEYCNLNVDTDEPMYPGDSKTLIVVNARQVEFVSRPEVQAEEPVNEAAPEAQTEAEPAAVDQADGAGATE